MAEQGFTPGNRAALIADIQKCADLYRDMAESAAFKSIRDPNDKACADAARQLVATHDARKAMADEIIDLVWKHWPKELITPQAPPTKAN